MEGSIKLDLHVTEDATLEMKEQKVHSALLWRDSACGSGSWQIQRKTFKLINHQHKFNLLRVGMKGKVKHNKLEMTYLSIKTRLTFKLATV